MIIKKFPSTIISSSEEDRDVVFVEYRENLKVDLTTAMEIVANRLDFTRNELHYVIIDMSNIRAVTNEAKEYMQSTQGGLKNILAAALVASNPVAALLANVFIKTPKDFQAKFFRNRHEALSWIYDQRDKLTNEIRTFR